MRMTLFGTGDATGMPATPCDCEYCEQNAPQRRPAVLVESDGTAVVLDIGLVECSNRPTPTGWTRSF
jgi:phosphoribosyl 1,2-cyclic phosphodiesterase